MKEFQLKNVKKSNEWFVKIGFQKKIEDRRLKVEIVKRSRARNVHINVPHVTKLTLDNLEGEDFSKFSQGLNENAGI